MSHELNMSLKNESKYTLKSYSVVHSWNGHNNMLKGENLISGAESHSVIITSGYTQYDWFTVQLEFDALGYRQVNFYCNSSQKHNRCLIKVHEDSLDLRYLVGTTDDTGCDNKGYSGITVEHGNSAKDQAVYEGKL